MISKLDLMLTSIGIATLLLSGCTQSSTRVGIKVPASATSVQFLHPSPNEFGVNFVMRTRASSYKYINSVRRQIVNLGYTLCKKSAISNWQSFPARGVGDSPNYWVIEMYTTKNREKFMLLRVDEDINKSSHYVVQKFTIASQDVNPAQENLTNINEFCGKP